jgi:DNA-directed RNA polymerase subunit omega
MIHPSYSELTEAINANAEEDDETMVLNSRYSLVLAASKRARQLIAGAEPKVEGAAGKKPLSVAIDEFYQGKIKITAEPEEDEEELTVEESAMEAAETAEEVTEEATQEATEETTEEAASAEETAAE